MTQNHNLANLIALGIKQRLDASKAAQPIPFNVPQPAATPIAPSQPNLAVSKRRISLSLSQADESDITDGRILPSLDQISLAGGRRLKAAILYSDLKGFTNLVASTHKKKTLAILHAFVSEMTRVTSEYCGEVVDCAGDRIMAVFWRPHNNNDCQPIHDALCCGFWMQTVMDRAFREVLVQKGLPPITCGIGIDYGDVIVTRVGIRNRNKLVLLGNAANYAAKLEDSASGGQTVISSAIYSNRPAFMTVENGWVFNVNSSANQPVFYYSNSVFKDNVNTRYFERNRNGR
jgi:adenylate cyclase